MFVAVAKMETCSTKLLDCFNILFNLRLSLFAKYRVDRFYYF